MSETNSKLAGAMAKAFSQIDGAVKDSQNPHFKNRYADLSAVIDAIKPALSANGLFFTQLTHESERGVTVETVVIHESGESMSMGRLYVPASKSDAQGFGSSLTYARRYSLSTAFGLRTFDDDAEASRVATDREARTGASAELLAELRTAAMEGPDALKAAFEKHKGNAAFAPTWKAHGESLKSAAAQAQPA